MPRYFFQVHDGKGLLDEEGIDLPGVKEAQAEGVRLAGAILLDEWSLIHGQNDWHLTVEDENGVALVRVEFRVTNLLKNH